MSNKKQTSLLDFYKRLNNIQVNNKRVEEKHANVEEKPNNVVKIKPSPPPIKPQIPENLPSDVNKIAKENCLIYPFEAPVNVHGATKYWQLIVNILRRPCISIHDFNV